MIAICGGLMRTGSVAMFQIMREIVEETGTGFSPTLPTGKEVEYWEEHLSEWATDDVIVIAKLHRWAPYLEEYRDTVKVVMTIRDMRDVTVSLMNFRGGGFEAALNSNAFKGNLEGQAEWEEKVSRDNLLKIRYEDFMLARSVTTIQVAKMLGINLTLQKATAIEQRWNINANLRRANKDYPVSHPDYMSKRHIKSGKANQWKAGLMHDQIVEVQDRAGHEWFEDNGYELYE